MSNVILVTPLPLVDKLHRQLQTRSATVQIKVDELSKLLTDHGIMFAALKANSLTKVIEPKAVSERVRI